MNVIILYFESFLPVINANRVSLLVRSPYRLHEQLSGERDFAESTDAHIQIIQNLEDQLSIKQMSIEILSLIDHHHHAVMPRSFDVAELARYTLALGTYMHTHTTPHPPLSSSTLSTESIHFSIHSTPRLSLTVLHIKHWWIAA